MTGTSSPGSAEYESELERRIGLLESEETEEAVLDDLPTRDIVCAVIGLAVIVMALIAWGYPW
ncbi:hypothetical protein [Gordonia sp. NPDC003376]